MLAFRSGVVSSFALIVAAGCGGGPSDAGAAASAGGVNGASGGSPGVDAGGLGASGGAGAGATGGLGGASSGGTGNAGTDGGPGACVPGVSLAPEAPWPSCFSRFAQIGPMIVKTVCTSGTPPTPLGGAIPAGIYKLQSRTMYGSSCPQSLDEQATIVICGDTWDWGIVYDPTAAVPGTYLYNYAVTHPTASSLTLTPRCETDTGHTVDDVSYTYAAGELTIIKPPSASVYVKM